jgi:hypothetical protein
VTASGQESIRRVRGRVSFWAVERGEAYSEPVSFPGPVERNDHYRPDLISKRVDSIWEEPGREQADPA